ncbi:Uncharacterised protein [uncultured archaeon]|nr:Uncharacterised protein [uncultured archaeon]
MIAELEKEFTETANMLLGARLRGLEDYGPWLGENVPLPYPGRSALSGKEVWVPPPLNFLGREFAKSRIISMDEIGQANVSPFRPEDLEGAPVRKILEKIVRPIAYYCGDWRYGSYENLEKASGAGAGVNVFYSEDVYHDVKNIAYSNYVLYCESMFGCHVATYSKFCIHAYNSFRVTRCFEVDGCSDSSDLLFCHNSEALQNCMFCFNAKSLRYAVGNVEVGRAEYMRIRGMLLNYIGKELENGKGLDLSIYIIGLRKK